MSNTVPGSSGNPFIDKIDELIGDLQETKADAAVADAATQALGAAKADFDAKDAALVQANSDFTTAQQNLTDATTARNNALDAQDAALAQLRAIGTAGTLSGPTFDNAITALTSALGQTRNAAANMDSAQSALQTATSNVTAASGARTAAQGVLTATQTDSDAKHTKFNTDLDTDDAVEAELRALATGGAPPAG